MNNWEKWQSEFCDSLNNHNFLKNHNLIAEYYHTNEAEGIRIVCIGKENVSLAITASNYRGYYSSIAVPVCSWTQSLNNSVEGCLGYIKDWAQKRGVSINAN